MNLRKEGLRGLWIHREAKSQNAFLCISEVVLNFIYVKARLKWVTLSKVYLA